MLGTSQWIEAEAISQIDESIRLKHWLREHIRELVAMAQDLANALAQGNKVLLLGNGGSAADAMHLASELAGRFRRDRQPLAAIALSADTSVLTAIGNDFAYDDIFSRQVRALARPGDVVIGISTSGNSPNVIRAVEEAKRCGARTLCFTGMGGELQSVADRALVIPSRDVARIQETYLTAGHILCFMIEEQLPDTLSRRR